MRAAWLLAVTLSLFASPVSADEAISRHTLPNGTRIILQRRPGAGTFALVLTALGGRAQDPADQMGLTEVLARMLLRGTATRSPDDQALEVERAGGTLDAAGGFLGVTLRASGPSNALRPALDVTLDAVLRPRLDGADLKKEIGLARQRLRRSYDVPSSARERVALPLLFGNHPLGRVADPERYLVSLDIDTLRRAHTERCVGRRMIVVVVGDIDALAVREQIAAAVGGLPAGESPPAELVSPDPLPRALRGRARHRTSQPELLVAMPTPGVSDTDEPAMDILSHILGGFQERLSSEIREKRGWAYWLAPLDWRFPGAGVFGILTAVPKKHLEETGRIIEQELRRIAATPPSLDEVDRARRYLLTTLARSWQQSTGRAASFSSAAIRGRPPRDWEANAARYANVTPEEVQLLAQRLLDWSALAVITLH